MKKNIKTFCLCMLFLCTAGLLKSQTQTQMSGEGVDLYGVVWFTQTEGRGDVGPNDLVRFKDDTGIHRVGINTPVGISGSCAYYNGKLYVNEYNSDGIDWAKVKPKWRIFNAFTWEKISEKELPDQCYALTYSCTYDVTTSKIYALADFSYMERGLVEIIPETGETKRIGTITGDKINTIACDPNGNLYGISIKDNSPQDPQVLVRINKANAAIKVVGTIKVNPELGVVGVREDGCLLNYRSGQGLVFNQLTGKLYWLCYSYDNNYPVNNYYTGAFEVDPVSAEIVSYDRLGVYGHSFAGAFFREPKLDTPVAVSGFSFVTTGDEDLTGKFVFTTPDKTYGGDPLTGKLDVAIYEGQKLLGELKGVDPGKKCESAVLTFETPNHVISTVVSNASGPGICLERSIVAGFDLPDAPSNIVLTKNGLTTTVSWDPPTGGVYGGTIDAENLNYTVYRYPGKLIVAEGLKETSFTETHPEDMIRYVYAIVSYTGSRAGGGRYSNNLIVGTPLKVPYLGFEDMAGMINYFTILDNNKDGYTWNYDPSYGTARAFPHDLDTNDADDWLISPAFDLEAGEYKLNFETTSWNSGRLAAMDVYWGTSATIAGMTEQILDIPSVPYTSGTEPMTPYEVRMIAPVSGLYHFGFHNYSAKEKNGLMINNNIEFELVPGTNIADAHENTVKVYSGKGQIEIFNPDLEDIKVIGIDGNQVAASSENNIRVNLNSGIYLVNWNGKVQKVIVK